VKFTITRLLDTSKILTSEAGQQLETFISYMAEFVDQTVRTLRSGITFQDNFACEVKTVSLKHDTAQVVQAAKAVVGILPTRVVSQSVGLDSFAWYIDDQGRLTVKAGLTGAPAGSFDVVLVLLF